MEKIVDAMRAAKEGKRWEPSADADEDLVLCICGKVWVRKNTGLCWMCRKPGAVVETNDPLSVNMRDDLKVDMVNHPPNYTASKFEVVDVLDAWAEAGMISYLVSNVIKYLSRYKLKGEALRDLQKAKWYLEREISKYE